MGYKEDVLEHRVGTSNRMYYKENVLGHRVETTNRIGYKEDVLERKVGWLHEITHRFLLWELSNIIQREIDGHWQWPGTSLLKRLNCNEYKNTPG